MAASEGEGLACDLARRAAESGAGRVVAIGGDGTAVEVAAGLLAAGGAVPMAHIPQGTANVLALNLGIPAALDAAIATAITGTEARIDVGALNGAPFLLSVGTGLHAEIVERADRGAKRRLGVGAYVLAGLQAIGAVRPALYRLWLDGEEASVEGTMAEVMNLGAVFRRSWALAPGISPVDGRLDVIVYRAATWVEYTRVATRVLQGDPTESVLVFHRSAARIRIEAEPSVPVQRDGERAGTTPAEIDVRPRALAVVLPTDSPWIEPAA